MQKYTTIFALSMLVASQSHAFKFDTGRDWNIRWDNTVKANVMSRVEAQDPQVYSPDTKDGVAWFLADDADLSVDRSGLGLVSTRLDLLTELDVVYKQNLGFRISASAWYDHAYRDSDHPGDRRFTWASPSVNPGEYTDEAEDLHYFGGEILDAFVFANFDIGDVAANIRAGRHTIYWGNSLLATGAVLGIAGSMTSIDFNKALAVPGSEAKELFLPYGRLSTVLQFTENLTLNAYYGFEHRRYRLPESGTYFSAAEGLTEDTEFVTFPPNDPAIPFRTGYDMHSDATEDEEWGLNLQYFIDDWGLETSFIYINYTEKNLHSVLAGFDFGQFVDVSRQQSPELEQLWNIWNAICPVAVECPQNATVDPGAGTVIYGDARHLFKEDIDLYGISLAKEIAGISVGLDLVHRRNTGLLPNLETSLLRFFNVPGVFEDLVAPTLPGEIVSEPYDSFDASNYLGGVGNTWHLVVNGLGLLNDNGIWEGGAYIVEATFSMLDEITENPELVDSRLEENDISSHIAVIFRPTWYQVFPGWDLTVPMTVSYQFDGDTAPLTFGGDEKRGSGSLGFEFNINQTWDFAANYNFFFGPVDAGIGGLLKDRDNISLTLKRTF